MDPIKHPRKTDVPTDEWETPHSLFRYWNRIFRFKIDAAASLRNYKCNWWIGLHGTYYLNKKHAGKDKGALDPSTSWNGYGAVWVNPPYSQKAGPLLKWCEKGFHTSLQGDLVVMLLKADTSTATWRFCQAHGLVIPLPRRVSHEYDGKKLQTPPWGSMVVIFFPFGKQGLLGYPYGV
jgi:phage N-6-adenine-methyltransferase